MQRDWGTFITGPLPDYRPYCHGPGGRAEGGADGGAAQGERANDGSEQMDSPESPLADMSITNYRGKPVNWAQLQGVSLALYFGAGNLRKCRNITPWLVNYYETLNAASFRQRLEIIYVPLDTSEREFRAHRSRMPWLSLDINDKDGIEELQKRYRVFAPLDRPVYAYGPKFTAPHLVIIGKHGQNFPYRNIELLDDETTRNNLSKWDFVNSV